MTAIQLFDLQIYENCSRKANSEDLIHKMYAYILISPSSSPSYFPKMLIHRYLLSL